MSPLPCPTALVIHHFRGSLFPLIYFLLSHTPRHFRLSSPSPHPLDPSASFSMHTPSYSKRRWRQLIMESNGGYQWAAGRADKGAPIICG